MSAVEEIKERLDVVDVISAYVPLRKSGRIYKALCPFHQEKTPSFVVYPDSGTWRCFGACGTGGDIFAFVMKRENVDFREALEILAQKAGVTLVAAGSAPSPQDQYLDRLREISYSAAVYFHNQLRQSAQGQDARDYLAQRGFDDPTIDSFLLGYAPDGWDGLLRTLREKNYQIEDILAAGLIVERQNEQTGRLSTYDRFRHRVMIPIRDVQGHVIGFGARALRSDQQPKYLNTPQSPLFDKSSVLFGLDAAHKAIRARGSSHHRRRLHGRAGLPSVWRDQRGGQHGHGADRASSSSCSNATPTPSSSRWTPTPPARQPPCGASSKHASPSTGNGCRR